MPQKPELTAPNERDERVFMLLLRKKQGIMREKKKKSLRQKWAVSSKIREKLRAGTNFSALSCMYFKINKKKQKILIPHFITNSHHSFYNKNAMSNNHTTTTKKVLAKFHRVLELHTAEQRAAIAAYLNHIGHDSQIDDDELRVTLVQLKQEDRDWVRA